MGRLRGTEAMLREREKLAALGTPLGRPGPRAEQSSRRRPAQRRAPARRPRSVGGRDERARERDRRSGAGGVHRRRSLAEVARHAATEPPLDPLDVSDRAWELETFLADRGMADAGELAPALVARRLGPRPPRAHRGRVPGRRARARGHAGSRLAARSARSSTKSRPVPDASPRSSRRSRSTPSWTRPRSSASTSATGWTTRW